jgi:hypothetical protein
MPTLVCIELLTQQKDDCEHRYVSMYCACCAIACHTFHRLVHAAADHVAADQVAADQVAWKSVVIHH